jgi:hypothetical protein
MTLVLVCLWIIGWILARFGLALLVMVAVSVIGWQQRNRHG